MFALRALAALGLFSLDLLRLDNGCIKTGPDQSACDPGYPTTPPTSAIFPNTNTWSHSSSLSNKALFENQHGSYHCTVSDESGILHYTSILVDEPDVEYPPYRCTNKSGTLQCQTLSYKGLEEPVFTHESLLYNLLAAFLSWPQAHPLQAAQLLACIAAPAYSDIIVLHALCNVGFCVPGIRAGAGSIAASMHSMIGNVRVGSGFAMLQSAGAVGQCLNIVSSAFEMGMCGVAAVSLVKHLMEAMDTDRLD